mgnify:CR=1 FL=1
MDENIISLIAKELNISISQVKNTLELLEEGATVPFIARYRKERTKGLDEEQIRVIQENYAYQVNLAKRKEEVLARIETLGKLDDEIIKNVNACTKLSQVEDIYRPYKQKKKTRASVAIANGLQPLADTFMSFPRYFKETELDAYINENVKDREAAIQGACDIIAEKVSDDVDVRNKILDSMTNFGRIVTSEKKDHEDDHKVYKMYYDYSERVNTLAPHRVMAIDRGEKEKVLNVSISFNEEYIENWVCRRFIRFTNSGTSEYVRAAILDGLKRLAYPSIERMVRSALSEKAHESSIDVFSMNLEKLLLQPPMKDKVILGFDPAFRTGCKLAVIDASGKKLTVDVIYPHQPNAKVRESEQKLVQLCNEYHVNLIAIGNGTASRESEAFVANTIKKFNLPVSYTIVSEAGASVYSASKLAIEEFPDLHVEQRSAISIARRLMDPLSELIKIDPQSIGVGQYQHDLPTTRLKERLDFVVEKAVNRVGVNINTASVSLLKNVAGLNNASASSIVSYREENGKIESRTQIKKIPKIGPKAFEQAAGFLRVEDGKEPLDRTSIHPESYKATKVLLKELGLDTSDLGTQKAKDVISNCDTKQLMQDTGLDSCLDRARAHVIQNGVAEYVVERVCLADVVRRAADDDGQLRLIVEVGDQIAVAENVAAGGDGLVHALGKVDRERVRRLDALAGDGLALLGVVKIIDAQADHVLLRAGDGREQPHARERQRGAAQHGGSVQRRPDADERLHVRTARHRDARRCRPR